MEPSNGGVRPAAEPRSGGGKLQPVDPARFLVNKVLVEHGHAHHLHIAWAELSSGNRVWKTHKA